MLLQALMLLSVSASPTPTGYLVVPVMFSDTMHEPVISKAKLQDLFFRREIGVIDYYRASSYGKFDLSNTEIAEPITLPKPVKSYISHGQGWERSVNGFFSHQRLADDISSLLNKYYDVKSYFGVCLFPNAYDDVPNSGSGIDAYFVGKDGARFLQKVAYLEPNVATPGFVVHEIGHHLNFSHISIDRRFSNTASGMSFIGKSYSSVGTVSCDHLMWQKEKVGWLEESERLTISEVGTHEIILDARGSLAPGLKLVKVKLAGTNIASLEAVLPVGLDRSADLGLFGLFINTVDEKACPLINFGQLSDKDIPHTQLSERGQPVFVKGEEWISPDGKVTVRVNTITNKHINLTVRVQ